MCRPAQKGVSINGPRATYTDPLQTWCSGRNEDRRLMPTYPGRRWVIASLVSAALSLAVTPVVCGPLGVVAGAVAVWKGAKWWGTAGVSASFCGGGGQRLLGCLAGYVSEVDTGVDDGLSDNMRRPFKWLPRVVRKWIGMRILEIVRRGRFRIRP